MEYTEQIYALAIVIVLAITGTFLFYRKKQPKILPAEAPPADNKMSFMKIQAYERLIILTERIGFKSLIERLPSESLNARELGNVFTEAIRNEFDHNLSQQIYVSEKSWQALVDLKDQQIFIINQLIQTIYPEAPGKDLALGMLSFLKADEHASMQPAVLETLRHEARQIIANTN
jgi:hypothetical protein